VSSILVVDDEARIREFLVRWLKPAGHDMREAPDAETALDLVASSPPDVVLCDMQMPGHGGLWLVEQMRMQFPAVAIVLATGVDSLPPAVSLQPGVVEYLVKPFDRERVLAAVARAVAWAQSDAARAAGRGDDAPLDSWLKSGRSRP
jgi:DNA-binding NtrC family response regulator